jgi:hypothetical protein
MSQPIRILLIPPLTFEDVVVTVTAESRVFQIILKKIPNHMKSYKTQEANFYPTPRNG